MQVDVITLYDLSIFGNSDTIAIWQQLNFTHTDGGRQYLKKILQQPLNSIHAIQDVQNTIQQLLALENQWPPNITNGTIMVLEKYFETPVDSFKPIPDPLSAWMYATFKKSDYSLIKYSVEHTISFLQGLQKITILMGDGNSKISSIWLQTIQLSFTALSGRPTIKYFISPPLIFTSMVIEMASTPYTALP